MAVKELLSNFFTHKDFLPPAAEIPGTLFTPLHFAFSAVFVCFVVFLAFYFARKGEKARRTLYIAVWAIVTGWEIAKILWESCCGKEIGIELTGILPLYPCSIFMYTMPFVIWGGGKVKRAAQGYICSLGLLGGAINFVYPANVLSNYSCISFAGMHTFLYHGTMVLCAMTMLLSREHRYTGIRKWWELFLPAMPFLAVSVAANIVNFTVGADYMFFKLESFIFAPIGAALPKAVTVVITYLGYLLIHALPYLPSFVANQKKEKAPGC